jgi:uncharacterized membrane protein YeiH
MTAIGGGTIRDLLLNRHPIIWGLQVPVLVLALRPTDGRESEDR